MFTHSLLQNEITSHTFSVFLTIPAVAGTYFVDHPPLHLMLVDGKRIFVMLLGIWDIWVQWEKNKFLQEYGIQAFVQTLTQ